MKVHHFIHDPKELLKEGQKIVKESTDSKFIRRVSAVNLILSGMSVENVAQNFGAGKRTINSWVKKVDDNGWEALATVKQTGRPNLLSESQISEIKEAVNDDPEQYGYHVWDGPALSNFINERYEIKYCVRSSQYLLHKMGFSLIRPQTYPSLDNPSNEAREDFKKNSNK